MLVVIGVNELCEKHFLAIEDGIKIKLARNFAEAEGSGHEAAKISDGTLEFWSALDEDFPETRHQRCWVHKTANILNCFPTT